MKKLNAVLLAILAAVIFSGCSAKFALLINSGEIGNIDPVFEREGTTETFSPTGTVSVPVSPKCANDCHSAYAGELFYKPKEIPVDPKPVPEPEVKPDPPPAPPVDPPTPPSPATVTEKGKYNGDKNPPWWNFYFTKKIDQYPKEFTLNIGKTSYPVTIGTRKRGGPGMDGPNGKFYVKQSDVSGRGMAIGIHKSFATKDVSITYAVKKDSLSYDAK